jgi:hypothetical protein
MFKFLRKDYFGLGVILGIVLPIILFVLLFIITKYGSILLKGVDLTTSMFGDKIKLSLSLVAIFLNMFTLRFYLLKEKYDKTGRGILISTFVLAIGYFIYYMRVY